MGSRVLVYASAVEELDAIVQSIKGIPGLELVGAVRDAADVLSGLRNSSTDVLVVCADECTPAVLSLATEISAEQSVKGIVVVLTGTVDNAGVISLLKSGVNAIISATAPTEDLGIAIREASISRLFIPPRSRDPL